MNQAVQDFWIAFFIIGFLCLLSVLYYKNANNKDIILSGNKYACNANYSKGWLDLVSDTDYAGVEVSSDASYKKYISLLLFNKYYGIILLDKKRQMRINVKWRFSYEN